jgi:hypothetical protein
LAAGPFTLVVRKVAICVFPNKIALFALILTLIMLVPPLALA